MQKTQPTLLRQLVAICAAFTVPLAPTALEAGETLDRVLAAKTLVLAVDEEYPPFSSRNHDGEMTGFDIDVARELANRLGVELRIVTPGWNAIMAGDWQGRWDIAMGAIEPTAERGAVLEFAAVYADAPAVILVRRGETAGAGDLAGKRLGVQAGSRYEAYLLSEVAAGAVIADADIVTYEVEALGIEDLAANEASAIDAMIVGLLAAQDAIGIGKPVAIAGAPLFHQPFVIAAGKGDGEFTARIAAAVETMRADGTLSRLSVARLDIDAAPPAP